MLVFWRHKQSAILLSVGPTRYRAFNRTAFMTKQRSKCWNGVMRQKNWNHCNYTWDNYTGFILLISIDCFSFSLSLFIIFLFQFVYNCKLWTKQTIANGFHTHKHLNELLVCVYAKTLELTTNQKKKQKIHTEQRNKTLKAIIIAFPKREKCLRWT